MSAEIAVGAPSTGATPAPAATPTAPKVELSAELDGGENSTVDPGADDEPGEVDLDALRRKAKRMLSGGREEASDDEPKAPKPKKPEPKAESKPEPKPPEPEDADDPEDEAKHREKLSTDGKIDDEKVSNSFAALRRKARGLAADRAAFNAERQKFDAERQAYALERESYTRESSEFKERRARASKEPLTALKELGWSWEQLTQYVAQNGQVPPDKLVADTRSASEESTKALKTELERVQKANQEFQDRYHAQQYTQRVTGELKTGIDSGKYPTLKAYMDRGAVTFDRVLEQSLANIANVWSQQRRQLATDEILAYYESDLVQQRKLHGAGAPAQAGAVESADDPEAVKPVTNDATAERTRRRSDEDGLWSEADAEEVRRQALRALRGA